MFEVWIPSAGAPTLEKSVDAARRLGGARVVVVDSSDDLSLVDRVDTVVQQFPAERFNFSRFVNHAIGECQEDYLLIWNDDAYGPSRNFVPSVWRHFAHGSAVVGFLLVDPEQFRVKHAGIEFYGPEGLPRHIAQGSSVSDLGTHRRCRRVLAVTAAVMAIDVEKALMIGGWDEQYANGYEDIDFCLRISQAKERVTFCGEATVVHHEALTRIGMGKLTDEDRAAQLARWRQVWSREQINDLAADVGDKWAMA